MFHLDFMTICLCKNFCFHMIICVSKAKENLTKSMSLHIYVRKHKYGTEIIDIYYFQIRDTPVKIVICTIIFAHTLIHTIIWIMNLKKVFDLTEMTVNVTQKQKRTFYSQLPEETHFLDINSFGVHNSTCTNEMVLKIHLTLQYWHMEQRNKTMTDCKENACYDEIVLPFMHLHYKNTEHNEFKNMTYILK